VWSASGLTFNERLRHGEDTDFFHRARQAGAEIVYSSSAVVHEIVPPERGTFRYQVVRAYYYAASRSYFHRRYHGTDYALGRMMMRFLWQVPIACIRIATAPIFLALGKPASFKRAVTKGSGRLAHAIGTVAGLCGFTGNPYRR
jgi:GT2 family glycosyltransferase